MTTDHSPTTPRPATVADTIVADLREARGWVCGATFYATYRPTFAQRISEINAGKKPARRPIVSRPCRNKGHGHRGLIREYALREYLLPYQMRLKE